MVLSPCALPRNLTPNCLPQNLQPVQTFLPSADNTHCMGESFSEILGK